MLSIGHRYCLYLNPEKVELKIRGGTGEHEEICYFFYLGIRPDKSRIWHGVAARMHHLGKELR